MIFKAFQKHKVMKFLRYDKQSPFNAVIIFITTDGNQIDLLARSLNLEKNKKNGKKKKLILVGLLKSYK